MQGIKPLTLMQVNNNRKQIFRLRTINTGLVNSKSLK